MERKSPLAVLGIEDDPDDAAELRRALNRSTDPRFELVHADKLAAGLAALEAREFDAVVLDLNLPDSIGLETLRRLLSRAPNLPILVMSGLGDRATALDAVAAGAQDYLVKGRFDDELLWRAVQYAIERKRLSSRLERLRAELRVARASKPWAEDWVGTLSHELRSPLSVVHMTLSNLELGLYGPLGSEQRNAIGAAFRSVQWTMAMLASLLQLCRLDASADERLETVDLGALVPDVIGGFRTAYMGRKVFECDVAEGLAPLRLPQGLAAQLLFNLIDNAARYSNSRVGVSARRSESGVEVRVDDDGAGIPKAKLASLFQRFSQAGPPKDDGYRGTGLGLSVCRGLLDRIGGDIWAENVPSGGARFIFTLPAAAREGLHEVERTMRR